MRSKSSWSKEQNHGLNHGIMTYR